MNPPIVRVSIFVARCLNDQTEAVAIADLRTRLAQAGIEG
jgi:hypothetical protein